MKYQLVEDDRLKQKYQTFLHRLPLNELPDKQTFLHLVGLDLTDVELLFLEGYIMQRTWSIRQVWLIGNPFTSVPNFLSMPDLEELSLNQNRFLTRVPNFTNLMRLKHLTISSCIMTELPNFTHLPALEVLRVHRTRLTHVPSLDQTFQLKILELQENEISDIGNLSHLTKIERLCLAQNRLTRIPPFRFPILEFLSVRDNQITEFPDLSGCPNLRFLDLRGNQIQQLDLDPKTFPQLERLFLDQIEDIDVSTFLAFPKLTFLMLGTHVYVRNLDVSPFFRLTRF